MGPGCFVEPVRGGGHPVCRQQATKCQAERPLQPRPVPVCGGGGSQTHLRRTCPPLLHRPKGRTRSPPKNKGPKAHEEPLQALPRYPAEGRRGARHAPSAPGPGRPERSSRRSCGLSPGTQMRHCQPPLSQVGGDPSPMQQSRLSRCGTPCGLQAGTARDGQRSQGPGSGRLSHLPHLTEIPRPGNVT